MPEVLKKKNAIAAVNKRKEFPESSADLEFVNLEEIVPSSNTNTTQTPAASSLPVLDHRVTRLETDFRHIKRHVDSIVDSLPGKSADEHNEHHEMYGDQLAATREKESDDKKLKRDLKEKLIKNAMQGMLWAIGALILLGLKSQFSDWVNRAVDEKASTRAAITAPAPEVRREH